MRYNTPKNWGLTIDEFENGEWGNVIGTFKVPTTYMRRMVASYPQMDAATNPTGVAETDEEYNLRIKTKMFNNLCQVYIDGIVVYFALLRKVDFNFLLSNDKQELKELIYEAVQHASLNRDVFEQVNNSNIQQGGLQINNENTGWILTINMYGKRAWSKLTNSELSRYKLVGDELMGKIFKDGGDELIISQWDNTNFKKNLGNYPSVNDAIADFQLLTTKPEVNDYFTTTDTNGEVLQYVLVRADWNDAANWEIRELKNVNGKTYLVKDRILLASSKGETGAKGETGPKGDKGDTGSQGLKGDTGPKGDTGATGPQGPKGDTGAQGPKGEKGDQGLPGVSTGATFADGSGTTTQPKAVTQVQFDKIDNLPDDTTHEFAIVNQEIQDLKDKDVELEAEMTAADTIFANELGLITGSPIDLGQWTANAASDVWETGDITGKLVDGKEYVFNIQTGGATPFVYKFFNDAAQTQPATFTAGNTGLKKLYKAGVEYNLTVDNNKLGLTRVNGSAFWTGGNRFSPNILEVSAKTLKQEVATLKSGGVYLGDIEPQTQNVIAELNTAFPSAKDGDHAEAITGTGLDIKYTTYTKAGATWTKGSDKVIHLKGSAAVDITGKADKDLSNVTGWVEKTILKAGVKIAVEIGVDMDTDYWAKDNVPDGATLIQGASAGVSNGQVKTTGLQLRVNTSSGYDGNVFGWNRNNAAGLGSMNTEGGGANITQGYVSTSKDGQPIISGGGTHNKAYGTKVQYWKLIKDIVVLVKGTANAGGQP